MAIEMNNTLVITSIYASSDVGCVRQGNEDNFIIANLISGQPYCVPQAILSSPADHKLLLAVADGMGGANAGEIASALAVYGLRFELLQQLRNTQNYNQEVSNCLEQSLAKINSLIWTAAQQHQALAGMGSAITAVVVNGIRAYIAEIGDSRAYVIRRSKIKQLTTDQSLFEALVNTGSFKNTEPPAPESRSVILQSLGGQPEVHIPITVLNLRNGDHLLICSDGLSNKLTMDEIRKAVTKSPNLEVACTSMISLAKERGGEDNITVLLAKFEGDGLPGMSDKSSITKSIQVLSSYNPLTGSIERTKRPDRMRITQQMVSNLENLENNDDKQDELFQSTLAIMPEKEYPKRELLLAESDKSIQMLADLTQQMKLIIDYTHDLEAWATKQQHLDANLNKALAHLEQSVKNANKIESVVRKVRNLLEKISTKE